MLFLLIDPWCEELEDISEEEEDDESHHDIDSPLLQARLGLGIISSSEGPCDTETHDREDCTEHDDVDEPLDDRREHLLESCEACFYLTSILSLGNWNCCSTSFSIRCSLPHTDTSRSRNHLCHNNFCSFFCRIHTPTERETGYEDQDEGEEYLFHNTRS